MMKPLACGIIAIASLAAGSVIGYFTATTVLRAKYEEELRVQIEKTKEFYAKLEEKKQFQTPGEAADALIPEEAKKTLADAVTAMTNYRGEKPPDRKKVVEEMIENIFSHETVTTEITDDEKDLRDRRTPYILEKDEYLESDSDFNQTTVTYYAGDETLADERDDIIEDIDKVVGLANLQRFGHGSGDPRVLYVRNELLEIDYEILLHEDKYKDLVAGM
jgi:hypothetical protein